MGSSVADVCGAAWLYRAKADMKRGHEGRGASLSLIAKRLGYIGLRLTSCEAKRAVVLAEAEGFIF